MDGRIRDLLAKLTSWGIENTASSMLNASKKIIVVRNKMNPIKQFRLVLGFHLGSFMIGSNNGLLYPYMVWS